MVDQIREAGGEVFGITSGPQALAVEAEEAWNLNFPIVGDPHREIRKVCAERDWLDLFYNENAGHLRNRKWTSHPKGYYRPGFWPFTRQDECFIDGGVFPSSATWLGLVPDRRRFIHKKR